MIKKNIKFNFYSGKYKIENLLKTLEEKEFENTIFEEELSVGKIKRNKKC
ncbi:MAG: hypothetical protein PHX70_00940 [Clostridium sp.]|nr:hypothetical protein [Clostridium sp.]